MSLLPLLILVVASFSSPALPVPVVPQEPTEIELRLEKAKKLLASSSEADAIAGAKICVELNSVESARLLLEVLRLTADRGLPAPHYRDVCWASMRDLTDRYAQAIFAEELANKKSSALVRQWSAELLGLFATTHFGPALVTALKDKDDDVRAAAARALGRIVYSGAQKDLNKQTKSKHMLLRGNSIEALALIDPVANRKAYDKGLKDKDAGVRCVLYGIAPLAYPEEAEAMSLAALDDEDWRPRLQGLENLSGMRTKSSVDALLMGLEDPRPSLVHRTIGFLQQLTHKPFSQADQWTRFWADNRETFDFPEGAPHSMDKEEGTVAVSLFNGIRLESDHVAFLMDKSQHMQQELVSRKMSKDSAAREELKGVLDAMQGRLVFNLFCYADRIRYFSEKGCVKLDKRAAANAMEFHRKAPISGRKDIWAALLAVMEDPELDTGYVLSSGEPDIGTYVHWERLTYQLKELNRYHKVVFHAIAYSERMLDRNQLEKIAEATGGEFKWFE